VETYRAKNLTDPRSKSVADSDMSATLFSGVLEKMSATLFSGVLEKMSATLFVDQGS
jgi:hypothetical protein